MKIAVYSLMNEGEFILKKTMLLLSTLLSMNVIAGEVPKSIRIQAAILEARQSDSTEYYRSISFNGEAACALLEELDASILFQVEPTSTHNGFGTKQINNHQTSCSASFDQYQHIVKDSCFCSTVIPGTKRSTLTN